jgi:hypothetical protein
LICLIFGLVFQSCIRQEDLLKPKPEQVIAQAKQWFEQDLKTRKINQQKSNQPLLNAQREPDWQKIWQENHHNAPLLEMPLQYDGKHLIGKTTDTSGSRIGITRLLLRQNEDGSFKPIIMRIFADSAYLAKAGNQFDYNTFKTQESDFSGEVWFYDWEETFLGGNRYKNG